MWVAWLDRTPGNFRFVARRSNRQGTVLGAPVQVTPPGGISTAAVNLDASSDRADLVALYQASGGAFRIAHTQLLPGLTLVRQPSSGTGPAAGS